MEEDAAAAWISKFTVAVSHPGRSRLYSPCAIEELQEALRRYTTDTLICIDTVRGFCEKVPKWMLWMETELQMIVDIKDRAAKNDLSRREELEKELAVVLKSTLGGLEKLNGFLDAVERLAVTSLHVFHDENQVLYLPQELSPVQVSIIAARLVCPLLVGFKRDASVFFLPKLPNAEVLAYQLDRYIQTTKEICDKLEKSEFFPNTVTDTEVDPNLSESDLRRMLCHINQLEDIRKDENFRTVFLFEEESRHRFISEFSKRRPSMLQFLNDVEESAVQLDRMNKGAKISSVAGSSVGVVGGVLSIIGLALIPVTAGVSLALTMTGVGLGITSATNSIVTTATEIGVNSTYKKKASEAFQGFMEDVQSLQECLDEATYRENIQDVAAAAGKLLIKVGAFGKGIDSIVDAASAFKALKGTEVVTSAGKAVTQEGKALSNLSRVASDIPDIGQAALKGPLALTKSARVGFIALNALFIGMDVFFICKDSISLAKGSETEFSKFIRARAALWSSEMDSWQKIHDSLNQGQLTSEKKHAILETPFHPEE
ncbi:hypothetical protein PAMA_009835 [Pampus argenteus]